jgi:DNA-binding NarL/FixJ family response regulator
MMADNDALVVARPGRLRDGLSALLTALPYVGRVHLADSRSSALAALVEQRPSLILLDAGVPDDGMPTLECRLKAVEPHARCIVITDDPDRPRVATPGGADAILLKGFTTPQLYLAVERLLSAEPVGQSGSADV